VIWEAAAAVLLGLGVIWLVLQPLVRPGPVRPAIYIPPDPEETRRGVALASLREIEFDRETGKLSDTDYAFLKARRERLGMVEAAIEVPSDLASMDAS